MVMDIFRLHEPPQQEEFCITISQNIQISKLKYTVGIFSLLIDNL